MCGGAGTSSRMNESKSGVMVMCGSWGRTAIDWRNLKKISGTIVF
jgi:hypothetical protein